MNKIFTSLLAAVSIATVAMPAQANEEYKVTEIEHRDLDLGTQQGLDTLNGRISSAIARICEKPSVRDLLSQRTFKKCEREVMRQIEPQLAAITKGRPTLALSK